MKFRKLFWLAGTALLTITLSACNLGAAPALTEDAGAIQTQAFINVSTQAALQQTQTAQALPPTSLPTNIHLPTSTPGGIPTFAVFGGPNTPFAFNTQQPGVTTPPTPRPTHPPPPLARVFIIHVGADGCVWWAPGGAGGGGGGGWVWPGVLTRAVG